MTEREFFQVLPKRGWVLVDEVYIRTKKCAHFPCTNSRNCPIGAVVERIKREVCCEDCAVELAKGLGLTAKLTHDLMGAADRDSFRSPRLRALRRRLMKHCGLKEVN